MSTDEHQILEFLKTSEEFFSVREISRRVGGKRRCQKEPAWAKPPLLRLTNAGHIFMNEMGHFRFKPPEEDKKKDKEKIHLAPHIAAILAASGKMPAGGGGAAIVHNISDE